MRGEHCVAGASIITGIAVILLIFANIGQVSPGALTNGIYWAEVNVAPYGNALQATSKKSVPGLYNTKNTPMGGNDGLRQKYRYGIYKSCGYQSGGSGICNSTIFGYPMEPLNNILADVPTQYSGQTVAIIGKDATAFKDSGFNGGATRAGSLLTFIGSCFAVIALITGVFKARLFFFAAAVSAGISALFLMIGAALWTSVIAKDAFVNKVKVEGGTALGLTVTAGGTLYLTWISFALMTLAVCPYVIACCTFRSK